MTPRTGDRGAVATEFAVVMTAVLAGFMLLVVFAGRVASAENNVRSAAHEAARAASLAGTPAGADTAARSTATANLTAAGLTCATGPAVTVNVDNFAPGGTVTVTINCTADFADLAPLAVPGSRTFTATATEVIDTYRSDP